MSTRWRISLVLACTLLTSGLQGQELPPRAIARLGDYRFHHGSSIELVALSPDGSRVASLARKRSYPNDVPEKDRDPFDRTIVVWDAASGQRVCELQAPGRPVESQAFTPDSKRVLVVCDKVFSGDEFPKRQIVFFDVAAAKIADQIGPLERNTSFLQFSADGKRLVLREGDDAVISFDMASRKPQQRWQAPAPKSDWIKEDERVNGGIQSPDGKFIIWRAYKLPDESNQPRGIRGLTPRPTIVVVSDTVSRKVLYRKEFDHYYRPAALVISPDSRWFMIGGEKKLTAWETATGKEFFILADPLTYSFWVARCRQTDASHWREIRPAGCGISKPRSRYTICFPEWLTSRMALADSFSPPTLRLWFFGPSRRCDFMTRPQERNAPDLAIATPTSRSASRRIAAPSIRLAMRHVAHGTWRRARSRPW